MKAADRESGAPFRALLVVNEPGEFAELLEFASLLRVERGAECLFVFVRPDYAAIARHSEVCRARDFLYIHATDDFSIKNIPYWLHEGARDDYRPSRLRWLDPRGDTIAWRRRLERSPTFQKFLVRNQQIRLLMVGLTLGTIGYAATRWWHRYFPKSRLLRGLTVLAVARYHLRRTRQILVYGAALDDYFKPDISIFGQDFAGSENAILAQASHDAGKPTLVLPFAMGTTKEINESLHGSTEHNPETDAFSRLITRLYPKWVNVYRGKLISRHPAAVVLALEVMGMSPAQPWTPMTGYGTLLLPSNQAYDYYKSAGLPESQLRVTGSLNDKFWLDAPDRRANNPTATQWLERLRRLSTLRTRLSSSVRGMLTDALIAEPTDAAAAQLELRKLRFFLGDTLEPVSLSQRVYQIGEQLLPELIMREPTQEQPSDDASPLIVVSWPTNQFGRPMPNLEFKDYNALSHAWARSLREVAREQGWAVVVSLHPTLDPDSLQYLESEYGFILWPGRLIEIIHKADIFVASVSSTLLWASNLAIPAINYDVFKYGYREFSEAGSIVTVSNHVDFDMELRRMARDPAYRATLALRAVERKAYWCKSDGLSEQRILQAFDEACASRLTTSADGPR